MTPLAAVRSFAVQLVAVAIGLALSVALLAVIGQSPRAALEALVRGAFGSDFALTQTVLKAVPLALTGLAVAVPLLMRLWNIGAEGQFHAGAIGATWAALSFSHLPASVLLPAMILASIAAGALLALLAAVPRALWGVNEIITTLLLNYVAILAVAYLVIGPWRGAESLNFPVSDVFPPGAALPRLGSSGLHVGVLFPLVAAAVLLFLLRGSKWGFELRMIGASPDAARVVGMSTARKVIVVMLLAGGLAGLAGMVEVSMTFGRLEQGISPGYGYMAIVIAALAGGNVLGTLLVSVLFGGFVVGGFALQTLGVPQAFVLMLQGIILFCALAGARLAGASLTPWLPLRLRGRDASEAAVGKEEPSIP
ncbi:MAG: ABC transporter permease [Actinomycetota bacterium]|nr:ABC transporter permease [Actinomycetota bacterium]